MYCQSHISEMYTSPAISLWPQRPSFASFVLSCYFVLNAHPAEVMFRLLASYEEPELPEALEGNSSANTCKGEESTFVILWMLLCLPGGILMQKMSPENSRNGNECACCIVHVAHLLRSMSSAKGFLRKGSGKTLITRIVAGEYGQLVLLDLWTKWSLGALQSSVFI